MKCFNCNSAMQLGVVHKDTPTKSKKIDPFLPLVRKMSEVA